MTGHPQLDRQIDELETTLNTLAFEISAGRERRPAVMTAVRALKDAIRLCRSAAVREQAFSDTGKERKCPNPASGITRRSATPA